MERKISVFLIMICMVITSCSSNKSVSTFEGTIDSIIEEQFIVNCSDEVNRGKKGGINSIGYLCNITFNSTTSFTDLNGNSLLIEDFSVGDSIRINLSTSQNITESNRNFVASEVILLDA